MAYELKTQLSDENVAAFIGGLGDEARMQMALALCDIFSKATGQMAKMWGPAIIGFGSYSYVYDSGHRGQMCRFGFSPRKGKVAIYPAPEWRLVDAHVRLLEAMGKIEQAKGCFYIKKLADIDENLLAEFCAATYQYSFTPWPNP